jgi:predicted nucleic-acid-binding Zn-ribbon protein
MPDSRGEPAEYESDNIRQHLREHLPDGCPSCGHDELNLSRARIIPEDAHRTSGPGLTVEEYIDVQCQQCLPGTFYSEEIVE